MTDVILTFSKEDWFLETLVHWTYQWQWIDSSAYAVLKTPKDLREMELFLTKE